MIEKKFILGDVFTVQPVKKLTIKGKAYIMDKDIISSDGKTPYIAAISSNNGITGYSNFEANNKGDCITLSTTADSSNTVFYQEDNFIGRQQIAEIRRKDGKPMGRSCGLYITAIIKKLTTQFNYSNKLTIDYLKNAIISLPVKMKYVPDYQILSTFEGGGIDMNKIDTSSWKEFKLGELFDIEKTWVYGKNKDYKTRSDKKSETAIAVVSGITVNNGVNYYTEDNVSDTEIYKDCLTITTRGEYSGTVFYHDYSFVLANNILVMPMPNISKNAKLFLATVLQALPFGGYNNYPTKDKLKDVVVKLPAITEDVPDWEYMEERIAELEEERIAELEGYLVATGLNDYELTDEDRQVLSLSGFGHCEERDSEDAVKIRKEMREFKLNNLFIKKTMKGYPKLKENLIENPNGYHIYGQNIKWQYSQKVLLDDVYLHIVDSEHPILAYTSSVGEIGMIDESFYRSGDNGAFQGLFSKEHSFNRYELQYVLSLLKRNFNTFGYSTSMTDVMQISFVLPIQTDDNNNPIIDLEHKYHPDGYMPDWGFMEKYIKAIEKIVIADVVKYKDEVIANTNKIVKGC